LLFGDEDDRDESDSDADGEEQDDDDDYLRQSLNVPSVFCALADVPTTDRLDSVWYSNPDGNAYAYRRQRQYRIGPPRRRARLVRPQKGRGKQEGRQVLGSRGRGRVLSGRTARSASIPALNRACPSTS
jgi:hypothetical protein